jgi:hypothetical protein
MQQMSFEYMTGSAGSQRWLNRRDKFVPPSVRFNPSRAEVRPVPEAIAKPFVIQHHYSGSYPAARFRVGLYYKPEIGAEYLAGVAVFSVPMQNASIPKYLECEPNLGVELGRLVLLNDPNIGFNAETWFIARAFRLLRTAMPQMVGVLSYSDPVARFADDGRMVKPSHAGTIYRAANARWHG